MKVRLYHDTRRPTADGTCPVRIAIARDGRTAYIPTSVYLRPNQFVKTRDGYRIVSHTKAAQLRAALDTSLAAVQSAIVTLQASGELHTLDALAVRERVQAYLDPPASASPKVCAYMREYASARSEGTQRIFETTIWRIGQFAANCEELTFSDVTYGWLSSFDAHMSASGVSANSRAVYLRSLRSAMRDAMLCGKITDYPFSRFHIRTEETRKRAITSEQLRRYFTAPATAKQRIARDYLRLSFLLLGINFADLCALTPDNVQGDRIVYRRAKTKKVYSVKILPETAELLEQYRAKSPDLLLDISERYGGGNHIATLNCINQLASHIINEPPYCKITSYTMRHSVATIMANELHAPAEVISAALGHEYGCRTTAIYIDLNLSRVDIYLRMLADLILPS